MQTLIIGSDGAQGRRYQAILSYLGREFICADPKRPESMIIQKEKEKRIGGVIVATPTDTHVTILKRFMHTGVPILCEKPICKDVQQLTELVEEIEDCKAKVSMVLQYRHLGFPVFLPRRYSFYDYFRHGNDGLLWDCLQIIGFATGGVRLDESSPVWKCQINGKTLDISKMDTAYVTDVREWLAQINQRSMRDVLEMHQKVVAHGETRI